MRDLSSCETTFFHSAPPNMVSVTTTSIIHAFKISQFPSCFLQVLWYMYVQKNNYQFQIWAFKRSFPSTKGSVQCYKKCLRQTFPDLLTTCSFNFKIQFHSSWKTKQKMKLLALHLKLHLHLNAVYRQQDTQPAVCVGVCVYMYVCNFLWS